MPYIPRKRLLEELERYEKEQRFTKRELKRLTHFRTGEFRRRAVGKVVTTQEFRQAMRHALREGKIKRSDVKKLMRRWRGWVGTPWRRETPAQPTTTHRPELDEAFRAAGGSASVPYSAEPRGRWDTVMSPFAMVGGMLSKRVQQLRQLRQAKAPSAEGPSASGGTVPPAQPTQPRTKPFAQAAIGGKVRKQLEVPEDVAGGGKPQTPSAHKERELEARGTVLPHQSHEAPGAGVSPHTPSEELAHIVQHGERAGEMTVPLQPREDVRRVREEQYALTKVYREEQEEKQRVGSRIAWWAFVATSAMLWLLVIISFTQWWGFLATIVGFIFGLFLLPVFPFIALFEGQPLIALVSFTLLVLDGAFLHYSGSEAVSYARMLSGKAGERSGSATNRAKHAGQGARGEVRMEPYAASTPHSQGEVHQGAGGGRKGDEAGRS